MKDVKKCGKMFRFFKEMKSMVFKASKHFKHLTHTYLMIRTDYRRMKDTYLSLIIKQIQNFKDQD